MQDKTNIAVLVSGGGTNLQALIDAQKSGVLHSGCMKLVISNNSNAYALTRAADAGIKTECVLKKDCADQKDFEDRLINLMEENSIDLIVLAGFMSILSEYFTSNMINESLMFTQALFLLFAEKAFMD